MIKFVGGFFLLAFGLVLLGWLAYNLLIERQKEFQMNFLAIGFMAGLLFVGGKWIMEGWESVSSLFQARKPKKKKKKPTRRPTGDDF